MVDMALPKTDAEWVREDALPRGSKSETLHVTIGRYVVCDRPIAKGYLSKATREWFAARGLDHVIVWTLRRTSDRVPVAIRLEGVAGKVDRSLKIKSDMTIAGSPIWRTGIGVGGPGHAVKIILAPLEDDPDHSLVGEVPAGTPIDTGEGV